MIELNDIRRAYLWSRMTSDEELASIAERATDVELGPGQTAFKDGDRCERFPLVLFGSMRVSKIGPRGREIALYRVVSGETCVLSASCLLGRHRYTAQGIIEKPTRLMLVPRADLLNLFVGNESFRNEVFQVFSERVSELMALVDAVVFRKLDQRLADRLLGHGNVLELTHQDLAVELGSVREIISRLLGQFEERGFLELGRERIKILDAPGLRAVAERGIEYGPLRIIPESRV
jgi:CRP/FNR family transcriptional regulator